MPRFEPVIEVIESLCLRSGDISMRNKGLFLDCAGDVWNDLNEDVLRIADRVKIPVRRFFKIDKRTNSVTLPCDSLMLSSVNVQDRCGTLYPVYRNEQLNEVVDVGAIKDCACEFECGNQLCNSIKGYEVINHTETDHNPDGSVVTFNCIDKKVVSGGFLYQQKQYPLRQYVSGVWIDTILYTENTKMCEVEVDKNGCVCDTEQNIKNVCHACGIDTSCNTVNGVCIGGTASTPPNKNCDTWIYACSSIMDLFAIQCGCFPHGRFQGPNIYNIDETGRRLIFPHNFGWDSVVIRYYADITLQDLQIPYFAKETFMTGVLSFATKFNPRKIQEAMVWKMEYSKQKTGLFNDLNRYRLAETRMMLTPPVWVPSYVGHRQAFLPW